MKLQRLFEMRVQRFDGVRVGPLAGAEGAEWMYWATGEGSVRGEEINGTLRAANHPRHRPDGVNLPDVNGVITTDRDETVYFEMKGFAVPAGDGNREVVASFTFRTAAERLARLNTTLAVAGGSIAEGKDGTGRYQVYQCIP